jgi:hypothetical protein
MVHNTTRPTFVARSVVFCTLLMHRSTGLGFSRSIDVLCIIPGHTSLAEDAEPVLVPCCRFTGPLARQEAAGDAARYPPPNCDSSAITLLT